VPSARSDVRLGRTGSMTQTNPSTGPPRIGVALGTIGVPFDWWRESSQRLETAGYAGVWCWDHFTSRGRRPNTVLECWTTLAAVAATTTRIRIGPLVANVTNRHPAVLARMAGTLQEVSGGRLVLGLGIGGHPAEHESYGIPFPDVPERVARLEESVAVLRALWTGGPVSLDSRYYPLRDAIALPRPAPPPPIIVGGQSPGGARLAARVGDGWTTRPDLLDRLRPIYEDACADLGRPRGPIVVAWEGGRAGEDALAGSQWIDRPREEWAGWAGRGASEVVLVARTTADVDRLVDAAGQW
jgi:alkanesulfonate monooxygenase SsuD/methylene tetrahydromethanopterin reductase-like flavin-dependent oxidoreductase (luciferase family)